MGAPRARQGTACPSRLPQTSPCSASSSFYVCCALSVAASCFSSLPRRCQLSALRGCEGGRIATTIDCPSVAHSCFFLPDPLPPFRPELQPPATQLVLLSDNSRFRVPHVTVVVIALVLLREVARCLLQKVCVHAHCNPSLNPKPLLPPFLSLHTPRSLFLLPFHNLLCRARAWNAGREQGHRLPGQTLDFNSGAETLSPRHHAEGAGCEDGAWTWASTTCRC